MDNMIAETLLPPKNAASQIGEDNYFAEGLVIINNGASVNKHWLNHNQPYLTAENRIGLITAGQMDATINMRQYSLTENTLFYIPRGSIIEVNGASEEMNMKLCAIGRQPQGQQHDRPLVYTPTALLRQRVETFVHLMYLTAIETTIEWRTIDLLQEALLHDIHAHADEYTMVMNSSSVADQVASRFIDLVNAHAVEHRNIEFYADRLCLSASRLMHIVKLLTGSTCLWWIKRRVLLHAEALLWYSTRTVGDIADELHFESIASFSRFFKQGTKTTPMEYRSSR